MGGSDINLSVSAEFYCYSQSNTGNFAEVGVFDLVVDGSMIVLCSQIRNDNNILVTAPSVDNNRPFFQFIIFIFSLAISDTKLLHIPQK